MRSFYSVLGALEKHLITLQKSINIHQHPLHISYNVENIKFKIGQFRKVTIFSIHKKNISN